MWELLELILNIVFECFFSGADVEEYWRFWGSFIFSFGIAWLIEFALGSISHALGACVVVIGSVAGILWEIRSRRK